MIALHLHRSLYREDAVEDAIAKLAHLAEITRTDTDTHWGVQVSATRRALETRVAAELGNFALGLTAASGGPSSA